MSTKGSDVLRVVNRDFSSNTYIYRTSVPGECILIDPGTDSDAIDRALIESGLVPVAIFCTHGHFDHLGSAEHFRRKYGIDLYLHQADVKIARASNFLMMALKVPGRIVVPSEHVSVEDGFSWSTGMDRVEVIHAPGHTPGSTVIIVNGEAFTGDTIYRHGVGLVSLPEENPGQLAASVRMIWDLLPDSTPLHPGHGEAAQLGEIKEHNEPLRRMLSEMGTAST